MKAESVNDDLLWSAIAQMHMTPSKITGGQRPLCCITWGGVCKHLACVGSFSALRKKHASSCLKIDINSSELLKTRSLIWSFYFDLSSTRVEKASSFKLPPTF